MCKLAYILEYIVFVLFFIGFGIVKKTITPFSHHKQCVIMK